MRFSKLTKALLLSCTLLCASQSQATFLELAALATGVQSTPVHVPGGNGGFGASITSAQNNIFVGTLANNINAFCFLNSTVTSCASGGTIKFDDVISNLVFAVIGVQPGDNIRVSAYLTGSLRSQQLFSGSSIPDPRTSNALLADFRTAGNIDTLVFEDLLSTRSGAGYAAFLYRDVSTPSSLALLAVGLLLTAARRRNRQA
jgi:hypothetical protein